MTKTSPRSKIDDAYGKLLRRVRSEPGQTKLPSERQLAVEYGVSRPVLREAIGRLQSQGMVEVRHGVGVRVVKHLHKPVHTSISAMLPDPSERMRKSIEARLLIEPEIVKLTALRASQSLLHELHEIQERFIRAENLDEAGRHDVEFHHALARGSGNDIFVLILDAIADIGAETRKVSHEMYGLERPYKQHARIIDALHNAQPDEAAAAMLIHLRFAQEDLQGVGL